MILSKVNFNYNSASLINVVFCLFPISFIFGNLIVNIIFFIFCCLGIFHLRSKIIINKLDFHLKIIFIFFLLILFSTSLNFVQALYSGDYQDSDLTKLLKSILFFRLDRLRGTPYLLL